MSFIRLENLISLCEIEYYVAGINECCKKLYLKSTKT